MFGAAPPNPLFERTGAVDSLRYLVQIEWTPAFFLPLLLVMNLQLDRAFIQPDFPLRSASHLDVFFPPDVPGLL